MLAGMVLLNCSVIHRHMALRSLTPIQTATAYLRGFGTNGSLSLNLFLIAKEMQLDDIVGEEVFNILSKEKQSELIGRKADFAQKAGISL